MEEGYLHLILGPMFSGKTTEIVRLYNNYSKINKKILVINYKEDNRYHDTLLSTHDKVMIPSVNLVKLGELDECQVDTYDVILINEGQFFEDLVTNVLHYVEKMNKRVYICGLDGDFRRKKFGSILDLIPYCDEIAKLKAFCAICKNGKNGLFSKRIIQDENQIVIGNDIYIPVCRGCYVK
jgi:thymidine kinase